MIPYESARDHFEDHLQRVHLLLTRHLVRHWHRVVDTSGKLNDLIVSLPEVWRMSTEDPGDTVPFAGVPTGDELEARLGAHREALIENARRADKEGIWLPIEALRRRAALTPDQLDLVMVLAALQTDVGLHRLATFAWADFAIKHPTVGFLAELIATGRDGRLDLRACATAGHRLRQLKLIECFDSPLWGARTPTLFQGVRLPERLLTWLLDSAPPQNLPIGDVDEVDLSCSLTPRSKAPPAPELEDGLDEALSKSPLVVIARDFDPRLAAQIGACLSRDLLCIHDVGALGVGLREALLQDTAPMVVHGDDDRALRRAASLWSGPLFVWSTGVVGLEHAVLSH